MTEQPYTPSIEEVARWWANNPNVAPEFRQPSFDRMLAAHDAEVRASEREDCDGCALLEKDVAQFVAERDAAVARAEAAEAELQARELHHFEAEDIAAGLAAKIEKVREVAYTRAQRTGRLPVMINGEIIRAILAADPSTVLVERDARVRREAAAEVRVTVVKTLRDAYAVVRPDDAAGLAFFDGAMTQVRRASELRGQ